MREDPVRILRAVRFVCKLGFEIEPPTYAAMKAAIGDLPRCSPSRLQEETFRLLRGGIAKPALEMLASLDALRLLLPPLWRFLEEAKPEERETFFACAGALDDWISKERSCSDAAVLACLTMAVTNPLQPETYLQNAAKLHEFLRELKRDIALPKRVAEACRNLLSAQRILAGQRKYKGGLKQFREHALFAETLTVFEIWNAATAQFSEELRAWKEERVPVLKVPSRKRKPLHHRSLQARSPAETLAGPSAPDSVPDSMPDNAQTTKALH